MFFFMLKPSVATLRPSADGGVGDLLDAVDVAGEAGGDDATAALLGEQAAQHATDVGLTRRVTGSSALVESDISSRMPFVLRQLADPCKVGSALVDRREVDLEVARVEHHPLRGVHGDRVSVRHRVGDRDELDEERTDVDLLAVLHGPHVDLGHQAGFLDAVPARPSARAEP